MGKKLLYFNHTIHIFHIMSIILLIIAIIIAIIVVILHFIVPVSIGLIPFTLATPLGFVFWLSILNSVLIIIKAINSHYLNKSYPEYSYSYFYWSPPRPIKILNNQ